MFAQLLGKMRIEVSPDSAFKEFWVWDVSVVRELGARVAHSSPH